ncbi:unnamed protein product [Miscanthus lutarioriparius]|uniref:Uncharacterized protein n=1 Tax=Miscanthus lutarioriparius TaxID=422564 RepID=A0A811RSD9_9POAL|nr:unnamed protein product [Miscanthus lutarioriparius]
MAAADRSDGTPSSRPAPPCHKSDDTTVNDGSPLELALDCLPALPALLFGLFLACSLVLTPRRQVHEHDRPRGDLAFVVFTYADLAALFWCARRVERLAAAAASSSPGLVRERDERRRRLQVAVWVLSTALSCAFAYRVSLIMPPALVLVVWAMASSVVLVGFYVLVLCEDQGYYRLLESAGDGEDDGLGEKKKSGAGGGELV